MFPVHKGEIWGNRGTHHLVCLLTVVLKPMERCVWDAVSRRAISNQLSKQNQHGLASVKLCLTDLLPFLDLVK